MAENGILDYQGMNQAIYRGATSNIVVDTQSMSIEIGAGNTSHTSNLHFECNHDANVASIKLNSNVTTEFSRSKKLIKYPRVALTSASDNAYENGYKVTVSNQDGSHKGHDAFDGIVGSTSGSLWYTGSDGHYNGTDGAALTSGANIAPQLDTNTDRGDWLGIELPVAIKLQYFYLWQQPNDVIHFPKSGIVYAKKETNDPWVKIYRYDDRTRTHVPDVPEIFDDVNSEVAYKYFVLVCTKRLSQHASYGIAIGEWQLFGVPEYDPEAHGTDVTLKSLANVPNTDWLEVYYDAKGLTPGAVGSSISGLGGTTISATKLGDPQVSNDAFVFDGSGDAIVSGATSLSGNPPLSYSVWFKTNSISSGYGSNSIVQIGHSAGDKSLGFRIKGTGDTKPGNYRFYVWGGATNESVDTDIKAEIGTWTHATVVYDGLKSKLYIDGKFAVENTNTTTDLNLDSGAKVTLGNYVDSNGTLYSGGTVRDYDGSIANVRLFNRALTADEIYQLYAYQKEEFGHSTNSMTLKAGRLGIGTSEPKAALDVRGTINATRFNTLVAEYTVISTTDSVEFTGLNLIEDGGTYKILWKVKNPVGGNPQYYMTVNGDTTETNYWYGGKQHTNTEGLHDGNYPTIFRAGSESTHTLEITMTRSCDGYIVAHGQGTFHTGNGMSSGHIQGWELNRWFYKTPGNVTSILFSSANTSTGKYGTGSNIQIHKYM